MSERTYDIDLTITPITTNIISRGSWTTPRRRSLRPNPRCCFILPCVYSPPSCLSLTTASASILAPQRCQLAHDDSIPWCAIWDARCWSPCYGAPHYRFACAPAKQEVGAAPSAGPLIAVYRRARLRGSRHRGVPAGALQPAQQAQRYGAPYTRDCRPALRRGQVAARAARGGEGRQQQGRPRWRVGQVDQGRHS